MAVFGIQRELDRWYAAKEPGGFVALALGACTSSKRVFAESQLVLALGRLISDLFHFDRIDMPMSKLRSITVQHLSVSPFTARFPNHLGLFTSSFASIWNSSSHSIVALYPI